MATVSRAKLLADYIEGGVFANFEIVTKITLAKFRQVFESFCGIIEIF